MDYRREIDGLRAVAMLPVILDHAKFGAFSGGFVGVDVFFVISGFLITAIIAGEIREGRFSLVGFYERRVRRIVPALFLVMLVCLAPAYLFLLPDPFENLGLRPGQRAEEPGPLLYAGLVGLTLALVIGASTARDFVNMILETRDPAGPDIVYREDLRPCDGPAPAGAALIRQADAVFMVHDRHAPGCLERLAALGGPGVERLFVIGPKHFGYNLNVYARLPKDERPAARARVPARVVERNARLRAEVPAGSYVDILGAMSGDGAHLPVFDARGYLLSADRLHLTRSGARLFGERVLDDPRFGFLD